MKAFRFWACCICSSIPISLTAVKPLWLPGMCLDRRGPPEQCWPSGRAGKACPRSPSYLIVPPWSSRPACFCRTAPLKSPPASSRYTPNPALLMHVTRYLCPPWPHLANHYAVSGKGAWFHGQAQQQGCCETSKGYSNSEEPLHVTIPSALLVGASLPLQLCPFPATFCSFLPSLGQGAIVFLFLNFTASFLAQRCVADDRRL